MKNIFKKNQIIITALAIMLAVAGYLNFSKEDVVNTLSETEDSATYAEDSQEEFGLLDLSDEDLAKVDVTEEGLEVSDSGEVASSEEVASEEVASEEVVSETTKDEEVAAADDPNVGEAVMVSNTISADYFASARLTREQTRAKSNELLLEIVNNEKLSEAQKEDAVAGIERLADVAEKESSAELLLKAKGFEDVVVTILEDSVDVIVNANELTTQQMAQIEDIVKRKTDISAENIVINPVSVTKN